MTEKDYVVGLFDGSCRIYSNKNELLHNELFHKDSVTNAQFLYWDKKSYLATTSVDQTFHLYEYGADKIPHISHIGKWKHSLTSIAQNLMNEKMLATGSANGSILLWDIESPPVPDPEKKHKKKKVDISELLIRKEIEGIHTQEITDISFVGPAQVLTGSLDHSIKSVDVNKGIAMTTINTNHAGVCSIDSTQNLVFAGLMDATIKQWDMRDVIMTNCYSEGIKGWIKSVAINPLNRNILISGGYDGNVIMWDIRGNKKPLQKICAQKDKIMAVGWNGPKKVVSGGSEGQLYVHSLLFEHIE